VVGKTLPEGEHLKKTNAGQATVTLFKDTVNCGNCGSDHTMDVDIVAQAEAILEEKRTPINLTAHLALTSALDFVKFTHRMTCHMGGEEAKLDSLKRAMNTMSYALRVLAGTQEDFTTHGFPLPLPIGHAEGADPPIGWPARGPPMKEFGSTEGAKNYRQIVWEERNMMLRDPNGFDF